MDYGRAVTAPPLDPPETAATAVVDGVPPADLAADLPAESAATGFTVRLANFTGPFDLLLQLIGKHKLDVTEVALHTVTDEFIAYIRAMGDDWDLDEASEFLLIAATLLDLKAARLLPSAEVEDEADLALLEARDLLFARLLQYKAYKEAAAHIAELEAVGGRRYPRAVSLEARYADALPDLVLGIGPQRLLKLAVKAMTPKPVPEVSIAHVHMVRVSVREHAAILTARLRRAGTATFSLLCADCEATLEVVARFLALLELYREGLVSFVQEQALEELTVRWTGPADGDTELHVDEYAGTPADPESSALGPEPAGVGPALVGAESAAVGAESVGAEPASVRVGPESVREAGGPDGTGMTEGARDE
ncbi:segregation/condensation protein A [Micromonospora sp. NPDC049171]|uniref:segregation and condensation protein A n=1 Tax=Micromonospora sp. NPDC049171 TaxID=3155770 RepID=UPI003408605F